MLDLGLTTAEEALFEATLRTSRDMRVTFEVLDRNEKVLRNLPNAEVLSGGVTVNTGQAVTRSLSVTLLDPRHELRFDADSPAKGAMYADNFVRVLYGVFVPDLGWVDVPVFHGPVVGFSRHDADTVELEAQSKETLALDPHFVTDSYQLPKGMTMREAIRDVMDRIGETKYALNMVNGKLRAARSVSRGESPWQVLVGGSSDSAGDAKPGLMRRAADLPYLFYDGRGRLTAKKRPGPNVWTFTEDQIVTRPNFQYDVLRARNFAVVTGGIPKGSKQKVSDTWALPAEHPLSPTRLARNGKPRRMVIFHESDSLRTREECRARARQLVEAQALQTVSASFDALPIPHLEPLDVVTVQTEEFSMTFPVREFTLPLAANSVMTVGANKRVKRPRRNRSRGRR